MGGPSSQFHKLTECALPIVEGTRCLSMRKTCEQDIGTEAVPTIHSLKHSVSSSVKHPKSRQATCLRFAPLPSLMKPLLTATWNSSLEAARHFTSAVELPQPFIVS